MRERVKTLPFLLAALMIVVSVVSMPLSAFALSAVTFTTEDTVTSASTTTFQQLYENGTNSIVFLDASSAGQYQLDTYAVGTSTVTTDSLSMTDGANTVNSAAYLGPVDSTSTLVTYTVGRDTANARNLYGAININSSFSKINATSVVSSYTPKDIAQSTTKLYAPLYEATTNGKLYLSQSTRAYGSYSEPALFTGNSTVPVLTTIASQDISDGIYNLGGTQTIVTERFTATAAALGKTFDTISFSLANPSARAGTVTVGTFDASGNVVTTFTTFNANTIAVGQATYTYSLSTPYTILTNDRIGLKFTASGVNDFAVYYQTTNVYDGTNAYHSRYASGAWTDQTGFDTRFIMTNSAKVETVVYDGSPDTVYTFFESGASALRVVKYTSSATLLGTAMTHSGGSPYSVAQMSGKILIQTASKLYELNTSTDAITEIETGTFLTRYPQTFAISPSARTYISALYAADSDEAIMYNPSAGTSATNYVMIDSASVPTLGVYDPAKYYYLQTNNLTIEGATAAATSWTIKGVGSKAGITVTPYTETVGIDLVQNSTIFSENVIQISCGTGNYDVTISGFSLGNDSDCNEWWTFDQDGNLVARHLPYSRAVEPVHTNEYTYYTFNLSVADPTAYYLETSYDGKNVDTGNFDSGGQLQQRLLYQQCYTINIEESLSGNQVQSGNVCAGDDLSKTISLTGIVIPDDWLGSTWSYTISRNYTSPSPSNNALLFTVEKSVKPYNASIYATDHPDPDDATFSNWYNFTNVLGTTIANVTGVNANQTIFFTLYENDAVILNAVSSATSFDYGDLFDDWGNLFGLPVAMIFPVLVALVFPKSQAYFGLLVTGAAIGVMEILGFMSLGPGIWAVAIVLIALGVVMGHKKT